MTIDEAQALMYRQPMIIMQRSGATWTGKVVGVIDQPCLILEGNNGQRTAIALNGAKAKAPHRGGASAKRFDRGNDSISVSRRFCTVCSAPIWHMRGSDMDTCRRGHHHPCESATCPDRP